MPNEPDLSRTRLLGGNEGLGRTEGNVGSDRIFGGADRKGYNRVSGAVPLLLRS